MMSSCIGWTGFCRNSNLFSPMYTIVIGLLEIILTSTIMSQLSNFGRYWSLTFVVLFFFNQQK